MTPQQIKDNAPEGATHYSYILNKYCKIYKNELWIYGYMWKYHSRIRHPSELTRIQIKPLN